MRTIKMLSRDIETNLCEAEDKIDTAYRLRSEHPAIAMWYKDMAAAHCTFNQKGHDLVMQEINAYKNSDEYKNHPEYADGMMAVWNDKHAEIMSKSARIKSMIDSYK